MAEQYLSPKELSEHLDHKISPKTLANWRSFGRGPRFRRVGNKILYPMTWIKAWEATTEYSSTRGLGARKSDLQHKQEQGSFHFGHPTYLNTRSRKVDDYRFVDTDEPLWPDAYFKRACPICGLKPTLEGHDPCLGTLPGVKFACCGHGVEPGYVAFEDGTVIRGRFTAVERAGVSTRIAED